MLNYLAAGAQLGTHACFGRGRRWLTIGFVLLPIALAVLARFSPASPLDLRNQGYQAFIAGMLAAAIVPILGVFIGSAALSDEVSGKTMVFLSTRPAGRIRAIGYKWLFTGLWVALMTGVLVWALFLILYYDNGFEHIRSNLLVATRDAGALALGGLTYSALGLLLASLVKKPMAIGIGLIFAWDGFVSIIPGYLKAFTIRQYVFSLGSRTASKVSEVFQFLAEYEVSDTRAIVTLSLTTAVFVAVALFIVSRREYAGDDPARGQ